LLATLTPGEAVNTIPPANSIDPPKFEAASKLNSRLEFDVASALTAAREGDRNSLGDLLTHYRRYLLLLATTQIERRLQPRVSPSDVVQETMLKAHLHFAQFHGESEKELLAWLRQILLSSLARFAERYIQAAKRDIRREVPVDPRGASVAGSTSRFGPKLPAGGPSPSGWAQNREESILLARRLAQLPPRYREVLVLRNIQGLSFEQVAIHLNRSPGATRMLWLRAIEKLRVLYRKAEQHDR
jgi:RNA polymerase sigma-70 factor (ECF subfamily)